MLIYVHIKGVGGGEGYFFNRKYFPLNSNNLKKFKACDGTALNWNGTAITSVSMYVSESARSCTSRISCSASGLSNGGSTGGFSSLFLRPESQNGIHSNDYRGIPDLSPKAFQSSGTKYLTGGFQIYN